MTHRAAVLPPGRKEKTQEERAMHNLKQVPGFDILETFEENYGVGGHLHVPDEKQKLTLQNVFRPGPLTQDVPIDGELANKLLLFRDQLSWISGSITLAKQYLREDMEERFADIEMKYETMQNFYLGPLMDSTVRSYAYGNLLYQQVHGDVSQSQATQARSQMHDHQVEEYHQKHRDYRTGPTQLYHHTVVPVTVHGEKLGVHNQPCATRRSHHKK